MRYFFSSYFFSLYLIFYVVCIFIYIFLKIVVRFGRRFSYRIFANTDDLKKILGRIVSYDDFLHIYALNFFNYLLARVNSFVMPAVFSFFFKRRFTLNLRFYYLKNFLLFIFLLNMSILKGLMKISSNFLSFLFYLLFINFFLEFFYFCLEYLIRSDYKRALIFLLNFILSYLSLFYFIIVSIFSWSPVPILYKLSFLVDYLNYSFLIFINTS